jgi:hypothetical protein
MIPSPDLDDRKFEDIVEEAKRLIPQYCPEWTNFNPSDPGITLIELFAWMTEMMLYRLNKVPEKNYLAFLELMGVTLRAPQPARALLQMKISEACDMLTVPAGTAFGSRGGADGKALHFETDEDVNLVNNRLQRVVAQFHDAQSQRILVNDVTDLALSGHPMGFEPFSGVREVVRYLYVGDSRLVNFSENAMLTLRFRRSDAARDAKLELRDLPRLLEWEYWTGEQWRALSESSVDVDNESVVFFGPPVLAATTVYDIKSFWLRGRLVEVPRSPLETELDTIQAKLEISGEGLVPDGALVHLPDSGLMLTCDLDRNFMPFHKRPEVDTTFYIASESVLMRAESLVRIEVSLSETTVAAKPQPSEDLALRWQYWNGKKWVDLARCTPAGVDDKTRRFSFADSTQAFTRSGIIEFMRPSDMAKTEVDERENFWIRCRVEQGNYGVEGTYVNVDDRWVYEKGNLAPPSLQSLVFKSSEEARPFEHVVTFNDWNFSDFSAQARIESKPFQPFAPIPDESPSLYLGFRNAFPTVTSQVYFKTVEDGAGSALPTAVELHGALSQAGQLDAPGQSVLWEYWNGKDWHPLLPRDHTANLTQSGFLQFVGPKDLRPTRRFGDELYWVRARLEMGGFDVPPRIERVLLNSVYASNIMTFQNAVLGSSQGTPNQFFKFVRGPVLAGQVIAVRELEAPWGDDLDALLAEVGDDAVREAPNHPGEFYVLWREVESLYESGPRSRHYTKDIVKGEIRFGDGVHGMIPPKGDRNVVALRYRTGGGEEGNVSAGSVTVMKAALAYLESVTNPYPASGGCDLETVDEVKLRGPHMIKSRNRAVTAEDFEWLSVQASNSVARVKALSSHTREGEVTVVVVPRVPKGAGGRIDLREKPVPSSELLSRVRRFLDERRLLTTVVRVVKPRYAELAVEVRIVRAPSGSSDRIKRQIDEMLRRFLHPLVGSRSGKGWPFGRSVYKADLYHVVEEIEGVDFVDAVKIVDVEKRREVDQLRLSADQLVYLTDVEVVEVPQERIV